MCSPSHRKETTILRRSKKRNLQARKPRSRHEKVECDHCNEMLSKTSIEAHYAIQHPLSRETERQRT